MNDHRQLPLLTRNTGDRWSCHQVLADALRAGLSQELASRPKEPMGVRSTKVSIPRLTSGSRSMPCRRDARTRPSCAR
jgi:hypothetical protein